MEVMWTTQGPSLWNGDPGIQSWPCGSGGLSAGTTLAATLSQQKKRIIFQRHREGTAYVLNKVHIACLLSASMIITSRKVQVRLSPRIEKRGEHKVACLAEEWLATDSCWDKESQISLRMNLMMAQPHSSGRPHFQEYISSINFICWVFIFLFKRDTKREGQNGWSKCVIHNSEIVVKNRKTKGTHSYIKKGRRQQYSG